MTDRKDSTSEKVPKGTLPKPPEQPSAVGYEEICEKGSQRVRDLMDHVKDGRDGEARRPTSK
jgi:hypothetical protein